MALFGGFQERREKKALERYFTAPSIDATEVEELKKACPGAAAILHDIIKQPPDHDKRFRALLGLQTLGVTADMVPAILDAVRDDDELVQESAAKILTTNREHAQTVIPALTAAYADCPASRPVILQILRDYGPEARTAAPVLVGDLTKPLQALSVARCLARIGTDGLDPVQRAIVDVLTDHPNAEAMRALGPAMTDTLEAFLLSCIPWRVVDAIPAWRRMLEAYAELCAQPGEALRPVLNELVQYSDWKLRGEVGAQFLEMSRAKSVAARLVSAQP